jgi:alpha-mannosidase
MAYHPIVANYGVEKDANMEEILDSFLEAALKSDLENVGVFYGLGNHGGGPIRKHVLQIANWARRHGEVKVLHSGLHRLFGALYGEVRRKGENFLPAFKGELNFCMRGCYASVAKFKFAYRKTEALLTRTERTAAAIQAVLKQTPADLNKAWDGLLFNTFHDILPGSSIERAYDDQLAWLGGIQHQCLNIDMTALNALASCVNTVVPPVKGDHPSAVAFLAWNPHPYEYNGPFELEACMDYRPILEYAKRADELPVVVRGPEGSPVAVQKVATEHASYQTMAWRKRAVFQAKLPPLGWNVFTFGWEENAKAPEITECAAASGEGVIENRFYRVKAEKGGKGILVWHKNRPVFGGSGMQLVTVEDPWGSWGGDGEQPESLELSATRHNWKITDVKLLEKGPVRAALWVKMEGGRSRVEQIISLCGGRDAVDVSARVFWNERLARLKLVMPVGDKAEFEVPGGMARRGPLGEVPGGRWVRVRRGDKKFIFASDALYAFNCRKGSLLGTICRSSRYATSRIWPGTEEKWRPMVDSGELKFRYVMSCGNHDPRLLAGELEQPPLAIMIAPHPGRLPRAGSLAGLKPDSLRLLALKPAENGKGLILRAQNSGGVIIPAASFRWLGKRFVLGKILPWQIKTWRLVNKGGKWRLESSNALEAKG